MSRSADDSDHPSPDNGADEPRWPELLRTAIRDPEELLALLALPCALLPGARIAARQFPLLVPRGFVARMQPGDTRDPLLLQVLPLTEETTEIPGYVQDPVAESGCSPVPGLLRKYQGRALLVTTGACAVHCRYCFRRHYPYAEIPRGPRWWDAALANIAADPGCTEIILSGGDPLTLPDQRLAELSQAISAIPHVVRLRLHTRLPVVLPERVDVALSRWIAASRPRVTVVLHANHANELDASVASAAQRLREAGALLLNQTVLLRHINDAAQTLASLSERLIACGVLPYYLHALDPVAGAAHFAVPDAVGRTLIADLRARLPGYLVPRFVRELPGFPSKSVIDHEIITRD